MNSNQTSDLKESLEGFKGKKKRKTKKVVDSKSREKTFNDKIKRRDSIADKNNKLRQKKIKSNDDDKSTVKQNVEDNLIAYSFIDQGEDTNVILKTSPQFMDVASEDDRPIVKHRRSNSELNTILTTESSLDIGRLDRTLQKSNEQNNGIVVLEKDATKEIPLSVVYRSILKRQDSSRIIQVCKRPLVLPPPPKGLPKIPRKRDPKSYGMIPIVL